MNVNTITMPKEEAERHLGEYRKALRRRADSEYEALAQGYAALAEGTPLINLNEVMTAGGVDELGRPRLAIARAERQEIALRRDKGRTWAVFDARSPDCSANYEQLELRVDGFLEAPTGFDRWRWSVSPSAFTLVPMVPAAVRNRMKGPLRNHFVLWEVETWSESSQSAKKNPPRDPYLLRHLAGELYVVVDEWDLTELERSVMSGRA